MAQETLLRPDGYTIDNVISVLRQIRAPVVCEEHEIVQIVVNHLVAAEIPFFREYKLGPCNRIDFYVPGGIGIEIKKGMPPTASLIGQLERYTSFDAIQAVILVVERKAAVPDVINGRPCIVMALNKLWGIAI